jgi:hypothetical protein
MPEFTMFDRRVFNLFVKPDSGEVIETRVLNCYEKRPDACYGYAKGTVNGYFDNFEKFCVCLRQLMKVADEKKNINIYITLQVINPNLIGRANNRLMATNNATTDKDVVAYGWLAVDLDPIRISGIPSSDEELEYARQLSDKISNNLARTIFPQPVKAMSGNGYHLLYPLSSLINDLSAQNKEVQNQVKQLLETLSSEFSNEYVKVDTTLFNPSRIIKLYGTTSYKGDAVEKGAHRIARPHRKSFIYYLGDNNVE